jgi:phosphoglycolate phosphatase-like HAD superfamily hydrolase
MSIIELHTSSLASLASQYGYPDISSQARDVCVDTYAHQSFFYPETEKVLTRLMENGIKMIVASDNDSAGLNVQKSKYNLDKYFSGYCISETARAYKPTLGFVNNLKKYLPGNLDECYFVGDSWVDVESGKRLGVKSVFIDRKHLGKATGADYTIHDLTELLPILKIA